MGDDDDRPGDYAIARIDSRATGSFGWLVRLQRNGRAYARFFADTKFGGRKLALCAARAYRDALVEQLSRQRTRVHAERLTVRNNSGVVGVCRIVREVSGGMRYEFWQATWSPAPGVRKTAKFSIKRYGDQGAFDRARAAREEGLRKRNEW